jgi:hypothetical protein
MKVKERKYLSEAAKHKYYAEMAMIQSEIDELPESEFLSEVEYIHEVRAGKMNPGFIEEGDQVVDVRDWTGEEIFQAFYADELAFIIQNEKDIAEKQAAEADENIETTIISSRVLSENTMQSKH